MFSTGEDDGLVNIKPALQIGEPLPGGKYPAEEFIGQGAFARVYRVRHIELNADRAVKVVSGDMLGVGSTIANEHCARFRLEAKQDGLCEPPTCGGWEPCPTRSARQCNLESDSSDAVLSPDDEFIIR